MLKSDFEFERIVGGIERDKVAICSNGQEVSQAAHEYYQCPTRQNAPLYHPGLQTDKGLVKCMTHPKTEHWAKVARSNQPGDWELRSELAAYFVRPTDVVCDLGAGAQAIRQMLPHTVEYVPVDCVKEHNGTFVADLNADFSLPEQSFDVILCLGLLRYIDDLPKFFERLIELKAGAFIVFTFGFRNKEQSNDLLRNEIETLDQGTECFSKYVDGLRVVACISAAANRFMFCGVLSKSSQNLQPPKLRSMRELILEAGHTRRISTKGLVRLLRG